MEGITILATEVVSCGIPFWIAPLMGCVLFVVILLILLAAFQKLEASDLGFCAIIGLLTTIAFLIFSIGTYKEETHYSMIIDETVPFVEFNEQYEVIDQKGEVYIVREKEGNEDK